MEKEKQEEYKDEKGKAMPMDKIFATSYELPDGTIAEMVYDKDQKRTYFIVGMGDQKKELEKVQLSKGEVLMPLNPKNSLLKLGFIKFPSVIGKYKGNAELFEEIKSYIKKYIVLPESFTEIASAYVMMTWLYRK